MKKRSNPHKRPIVLEISILADTKQDLVRALEVALSNAKGCEFDGNANISGGGGGYDTCFEIRTEQ